MEVEIGDRIFYRGLNRGGAQDDRWSRKFGAAERKKSEGDDRFLFEAVYFLVLPL